VERQRQRDVAGRLFFRQVALQHVVAPFLGTSAAIGGIVALTADGAGAIGEKPDDCENGGGYGGEHVSSSFLGTPRQDTPPAFIH
jgi:hypothetical protein